MNDSEPTNENQGVEDFFARQKNAQAAGDSEQRKQWFVEEFHLRSPVEEFQEHAKLEINRLRNGNANASDALHRAAADLVLRKLRGDKTEAAR